MRKLLLVLSCLLSVVAAASAQNPAPKPNVHVGGADGGDPLERHLVPPEIIMQYQSLLGITSRQREEIKKQVSALQTRFTELQWDLQAQMEALSESLTHLEAQEDAVLAQLDQVLASEAQIKRTQLSMLLRIRGILTAEQLKKAREIQHVPQLGFSYGNYTKEIQRYQRDLQAYQRALQEAQKKLRELQ